MTDALTSHTDLASTIVELAGGSIADTPTLFGESIQPLFSDQEATVRDHVLFHQEWPWYNGVEQTRYASSGIFDGRYKYCRYYGVGGGHNAMGQELPGKMLYGRDAGFEDHEHEWYDLDSDPHELVNLAMDRSRRVELRQRFDDLRAIEEREYRPIEQA